MSKRAFVTAGPKDALGDLFFMRLGWMSQSGIRIKDQRCIFLMKLPAMEKMNKSNVVNLIISVL